MGAPLSPDLAVLYSVLPGLVPGIHGATHPPLNGDHTYVSARLREGRP